MERLRREDKSNIGGVIEEGKNRTNYIFNMDNNSNFKRLVRNIQR